MHVLALDVGTSSVKAAVLDQRTGNPVARPVKASYPLDHPSPDAAEVRPDVLWAAVSSAATRAVAAARGRSVDGIGLSVLTPALFLLDDADRVLVPVRIHLDRRSRPVARKVLEEVGDEFLATVGNRPLPGGISAVSFAQILAEQPDLRAKVRHYLHVNGWLGLRLTGERRFDVGNASFSGLFNTVTDRQWSPRWCEYFGVDPGWLPPTADGAETLGGLRQEIADEWGMKPDTPVKVGVPDTSSAILACGMTPNDLLHVVGTTQVLACLTDSPTPDPRRLTRMLGTGGRYVYVAHNPVGGAALAWMHELCFRDQPADEFYGETIPNVVDRTTDVALDPPFLGGDRLEIEARIATFSGISLDDDRDDLLAAVLRAMRSGHRGALAAVGRADSQSGRVFLTGGGADTIRRLLPEYGRIELTEIEEGSLRGVARLFDPPASV